MTELTVHLIPAFSDNYVHVLRDPQTGVTAVVDPGEAAPVLAGLDRLGWRPDLVLLTHHHADHIGGTAGIKDRFGCKVIGAAADRARLPALDRAVADGDRVAVGSIELAVLETPGHTVGHIAYAGGGALFCGDTLFSLGCGRLFEGTPAQMWQSLSRLRALPESLRVYCAHEYTAANARFAVSVDPDNAALQQRVAEIGRLRAAGQPTVPALLADERAANPFLCADQPDLAQRLGLAGAPAVDVFAELRRRKDHF